MGTGLRSRVGHPGKGGDQGDARPEPALVEDGAQVGLHGVRRDEKCPADLGVAQPLSDETHDLLFPHAQPPRRRGRTGGRRPASRQGPGEDHGHPAVPQRIEAPLGAVAEKEVVDHAGDRDQQECQKPGRQRPIDGPAADARETDPERVGDDARERHVLEHVPGVVPRAPAQRELRHVLERRRGQYDREEDAVPPPAGHPEDAMGEERQREHDAVPSHERLQVRDDRPGPRRRGRVRHRAQVRQQQAPEDEDAESGVEQEKGPCERRIAPSRQDHHRAEARDADEQRDERVGQEHGRR